MIRNYYTVLFILTILSSRVLAENTYIPIGDLIIPIKNPIEFNNENIKLAIYDNVIIAITANGISVPEDITPKIDRYTWITYTNENDYTILAETDGPKLIVDYFLGTTQNLRIGVKFSVKYGIHSRSYTTKYHESLDMQDIERFNVGSGEQAPTGLSGGTNLVHPYPTTVNINGEFRPSTVSFKYSFIEDRVSSTTTCNQTILGMCTQSTTKTDKRTQFYDDQKDVLKKLLSVMGDILFYPDGILQCALDRTIDKKNLKGSSC